jgi:hypothetical protein
LDVGASGQPTAQTKRYQTFMFPMKTTKSRRVR